MDKIDPQGSGIGVVVGAGDGEVAGDAEVAGAGCACATVALVTTRKLHARTVPAATADRIIAPPL
jgi:hypothetical protein